MDHLPVRRAGGHHHHRLAGGPDFLRHHALRLDHTLAAIQGGATVYEASLKVFNSLTFTPHEWRFAMVETLAHLENLRLRGKVRQETDDYGLWRFYLTST